MRTNAKQRLDRLVEQGVKPLGTFVMSNDPTSSAIVSSAGYDFVIIDREHGMIDLASAVNHIRAVEMGGAIPFIRVLESTPTTIQQALDAGAHGVVVPKAEDAVEMERLVRASRYTPGGRGKCPTTPGAGFNRADWEVRAARHNENVVLMPLIETSAGVENAAKIAAIEGIDYLLFGPADLSQDLGLDMDADRDKIRDVYNEVRDAIRPTGARIGAPAFWGLDDADFLTVGSDLSSIQARAAEGVAMFRPQDN
jgi:4-hydroxy-2-oxoheptanedioate aldolase